MRDGQPHVGACRRRGPRRPGGRRARGAGRRRRRTRSWCHRPPCVANRLVRSSQPASRNADLQLRPGQLRHVGAAVAVVGQQVAATGCAAWASSSRWSRRRTRPGTSSSVPSASSTTGTERAWPRLSPVLITRSGRRSPSVRNHSCLRVWPGVMWMSLRCRTRSGCVPGGEHRHRDLAQHEGAGLPRGVRREPRAGDRPRARRPGRRRGGIPCAQAFTRAAQWAHGRPQGPTPHRPHRLDEGARRDPLVDAADGAHRDHQRGGRPASRRASSPTRTS